MRKALSLREAFFPHFASRIPAGLAPEDKSGFFFWFIVRFGDLIESNTVTYTELPVHCALVAAFARHKKSPHISSQMYIQ